MCGPVACSSRGDKDVDCIALLSSDEEGPGEAESTSHDSTDSTDPSDGESREVSFVAVEGVVREGADDEGGGPCSIVPVEGLVEEGAERGTRPSVLAQSSSLSTPTQKDVENTAATASRQAPPPHRPTSNRTNSEEKMENSGNSPPPLRPTSHRTDSREPMENSGNSHKDGGTREQPACTRGSSSWQDRLLERKLEEHPCVGRGQREVGLFFKRQRESDELIPVPHGSRQERWWLLNQPRSGPDFLPVTKRDHQCAREQGLQHLPQYSMIRELCDLRVGDACLFAAHHSGQSDWWHATVKKVEEHRVQVLIDLQTEDDDARGENIEGVDENIDTMRWVDYAAPEKLPCAPPGGHRVLSMTVHLNRLPHPWTGKFVIDIEDEAHTHRNEKVKGRWTFTREDDAGGLTIKSEGCRPSDDNLFNLYQSDLYQSRLEPLERKKQVDLEIAEATKKAKKMFPYLAEKINCPDMCDVSQLRENYGGESCYRCGEGGDLIICDGCPEEWSHFAAHPNCCSKPRIDPSDPWLCDECHQKKYNSDRVRTTSVVCDEHYKYIHEKFNPDDYQPLEIGEVKELSFKMPEIGELPKNYAIGLIMGPSGSGKTLLLKGRFSYEEPNHCWQNDKSVASQVHEPP